MQKFDVNPQPFNIRRVKNYSRLTNTFRLFFLEATLNAKNEWGERDKQLDILRHYIQGRSSIIYTSQQGCITIKEYQLCINK